MDELTKFLKWVDEEMKTSEILEDENRVKYLQSVFDILDEYIKINN